jgi:hypothetical protein
MQKGAQRFLGQPVKKPVIHSSTYQPKRDLVLAGQVDAGPFPPHRHELEVRLKPGKHRARSGGLPAHRDHESVAEFPGLAERDPHVLTQNRPADRHGPTDSNSKFVFTVAAKGT